MIRVGSVPTPPGYALGFDQGSDPYTLAAAIDHFYSAASGSASLDVVIASATDPAYAMPAAGWAAESGDPVLFVNQSSVPAATRQALLAHQRPHIYVLGPPSVIARRQSSRSWANTARSSGSAQPTRPPTRSRSPSTATRRAPTASRAPTCPAASAGRCEVRATGMCCSTPASRSTPPRRRRCRAAPTSGPSCWSTTPATLPTAVLNYFLDYATPGYTQEGPTAAVYNHGWVIGDQSAISLPVAGRDGQSAPSRAPEHEMSQAENPERLRAEPHGHRRGRPSADGRVDAALRAPAPRADPGADPGPARGPPGPPSRASARSRGWTGSPTSARCAATPPRRG